MFGLIRELSKFEEYDTFVYIIVTAWYSLFKLIELVLRTLCLSLPDLVELLQPTFIGAGSRVPGGVQAPPELFLAPLNHLSLP